jgi:hypothetical protein
VPPEGLWIVRFSPFSVAGCQKNAQGTFDDDIANGRPGRYGVSAYGFIWNGVQDQDEAIRQLCANVPVGGRTISVVDAVTVQAAGWRIVEDIPPDQHYLIGQNDFSQMPDVDALAVLWATHRRKNPAWQGS